MLHARGLTSGEKLDKVTAEGFYMPNGSQGLDCRHCSHFEGQGEMQAEGLCKRFGKPIDESYHSVCRDWFYGEEDIDERVKGQLSNLEYGRLYGIDGRGQMFKIADLTA